MFVVETYTAPSNIHGFGVFTAVDIKKGQVVWEFDNTVDSVITMKEYSELEPYIQQEIARCGFFSQDQLAWILGGDDDRYSNHSSQPNLIESGAPAMVTPMLIAANDIPAHTELTQNYLSFDGRALQRGICYESA